MNRRTCSCALVCLTFLAAGCGDSSRTILRDALTTWNELADVTTRIPGDPDNKPEEIDAEQVEEVAGQLLKNELELLKKKMEKIKKKAGEDRFSKPDKDERPVLYGAVTDLKEEAQFAIGRLVNEFGGRAFKGENARHQPQWLVVKKGRLTKIMEILQAKKHETANLQSILSLLDQFAVDIPPMAADTKTWQGDQKNQGGGGPVMPGGPGMMMGSGKAVLWEYPDDDNIVKTNPAEAARRLEDIQKKLPKLTPIARYAAWWAFPKSQGGGMGPGMPGGGGPPGAGGPPGGGFPPGGGPPGGGFPPGGGPPGGGFPPKGGFPKGPPGGQ
jgi:hypothetical protein